MSKKTNFILSVIRSYSSLKKSYKNDFKTTPRPIALHFETTYSCTCKCVFCNRWKEGPKNVKDELTIEEINNMIKQAYDLGVRMISLSGGEPLLKKEMINSMKYAKKIGMETNITTNGTMINDNNVKDIIEAFDIINISLDSLDEEKHD
jgi:MoaA/NifB/PqqE/SkfB family radical SAM enzyme